MSIGYTFYTVYGVRINSYVDELDEEMEEQHDRLTKDESVAVIMDSIGGSYVVIGKVLFNSGNIGRSNFKDSSCTINIEDLTSLKDNAIESFLIYFPDLGYLLNGEWNLMTFVHYS